MKKTFIFKIVLACLTLCISLNARTQTRASLPSSFTETSVPTGEVRFPAEFEPVQAVVIAHYQEGRNLPARLIKQMAQEVKVITLVNTDKYFTTEQVRNLYASELTEEELANCEFIEAPLNGRWTRDFTPWIIFNGTEPAIVENIYNRCYVYIDNNNNVSSITDPNNDSRAKLYDDAIPQYFKEYFKDENGNTISLPMYGMKVVHTGGNMMQDGRGVGVSDLIVHTESEEFLGQTYDETNQKMKDYLGIDPYHVTIDPQGKYIAHVDCWGKFLAPDKIIIAAVPSTNDQYDEYEEVANYFATTNCCWGYPYKVYRVSVPDRNGNTNIAAPYTNSLILNKKVFVPLDADTESQYNEAALQVYRDAMPGYTIIGVEYNYNDEFFLENDWAWDGWYNTDALHCRTHEIMDFNMLFVDHRNVLFGEQAYKESYPITAKFIAYSGDNITSTQLHYSINDDAYQTVEMTATGNADEYAANITGYNIGDVIEYYVTGVDASGRTCVQPQFGELEPHTFTVGEASDEEPETPVDPEPTPEPLVLTADKTTFTANGADAVTFTVTQGGNAVNDATIYIDGNAQTGYKFSTTTAGTYTVYAQKGDLKSDEITITAEAPAVIKPVIDLTKYYRIKVNSGTYTNQYLHISNTANTVITNAKANDLAQIFKIEDAGNGNYYLKSANNLYIKCDAAAGAWWSIYGNATNKTPLLFEYDDETVFYIRDYDKITGASVSTNTGSDSAKSYFKVESGTVYCDAPKTLAEVVTWTLEEVPLSITISANNNPVTVNESVQLNATATGGTGNYTYSWSPADGLSNTTIANPTFTSATAGTYDISCTVTSGTESVTSNTVTITVKEAQQGEDTGSGVVTIGKIDGAENNNVYPYISNQNYSTSQQIYTATEIGRSGTISKIAFYLYADDVNESVNDVKIYITHTTKNYFSSRTDWDKNVTSEHLVYDGNLTITNSVLEIPLTPSFEYNGTDNLLVCFDVNSKQTRAGYKIYTAGAAQAMYHRNSNNCGPDGGTYYNNQASSNPSTNVPVISLTFGTTPDQPEKPTITVDKQRFLADNSDYVTFTVNPEDAEIWYTAGTDTYQLTTTDKSFKTSNAGTYSFFAKKDDLTSDPIEVVAVAENELVLTLSKNTIVANGIEEVTFSVTQNDIDGEPQDVTNKCTFKIDGTAITGNTFFTNRAGKYTVTATKNSKETSAQITATAVSGEENVVLIDGNVMQPAENTTTYTVPVNNYDNYGVSQQYYTKSEIGKDEGIITYIAFKTAKDAGTYIRDIEIYMANTDESDFGSGKVMKQMTNLVYSGNVQFSSNSWIKIPLTTEFTYTGNNILVCINDKTGSQIDPLTSHFDTYAKGYNDNFRTLYKSGATALDPTSEIADARGIGFTPFVKFTFEQEQPITLVGTKQIIKADNSDIIRFTVTQGVNNVTDKTEIYVEQYEGTTTINTTVLNSTTGHTFSTSNAGTYRAYARKGDLTSNTIEFTSVHPIILTADKTSIIVGESVTFTLMQNSVDVTTANGTVIYVGDNVITKTFSTTMVGTFIAYATRDGIRSNGMEIIVNDKNYDDSEGFEGGSDNEYFNGNGSITYNKGEANEYTLIAKKIGNVAYIVQDNVKVNATGDYYWQYNDNKPKAPTTLTIPEKVLFGDEWVTITKIDEYAFSNTCDISDDGRTCYEPGNPYNQNFTNVIIPSTINEIGTYTFGFEIENNIICFAKTPPTLKKPTTNNPFVKKTYQNVILYVPAESIEAYRNASGWGVPFMGGDEYCFQNIYPITMPTYVEREKDDLSWNNADNWRTYVKGNDETYTEQYGVMPNAGEDVLIDGNVTIPENCVANAGNINIISGSITIADGGQLIHTNAGLTVTMEKEIVGYGSSTSPTSWYTISSPIFNFVKASDVNNLLSNDYDLYRYDEPTHYWDNIEDLDDLEGPQGNWETLDAGRGYLYANSGDVTLQFNGVANHTSASYTLTRGTEDGKLEGFHLVGNPFTHNIYMNAFSSTSTLADGYYVLSSEGAWGAELGSDKAIKPCQGVLINAAEGTLTINKNVGNVVTRSRANNKFVTISIANNKYEDVAYVSFDAKNPLEKVSHHNNNIPMVYIPTEEAIYAIATMEDDVKEIPVAFEAKTMGQYTISVKAKNCEFESMNLVDRKTGEETNLLLEDYTFLATTTDNSERFIIRLNDNISDNEDFIFINNGEIIINKIEGKGVLQIFDVMGRYISHSEVSGSANISTEAFTNGVYIIRMTDDNGVKTQKVVL